MNFIEAAFSGLAKPIEGRVSRSCFLGFSVFLFNIVFFALLVVVGVLGRFSPMVEDSIILFLLLLIIYPIICTILLLVKRLHDTNHSGWTFWLLPYALYLIFQEGDKDSNTYGEVPKS